MKLFLFLIPIALTAANLTIYPPSVALTNPESRQQLIAESTTALKRLSVSDAVMELDLTGVEVLLFRHAGHGRVNLVYRRGDGHIGWIDPPVIQADEAH